MTDNEKAKRTRVDSSAALAHLAPGFDCSYEELQLWMTEMIRHQRGPQGHLQLSAAAALHFQGSARLKPAEQIHLYRRQFWLRHTSSLIADSPGLTHHLGQKRWEKLVEDFLTKRAPDSRFLGKLGRLLPPFIGKNLKANDCQLCVELAELEWSYQQIFDEADRMPFDFTRLNHLDESEWLQLGFEVNPALRLLQQSYPLANYRRALLKKENPSLPQAAQRFLVVYRRDERLWDREVSAPCFFFLKALKEGLNLSQACETVVNLDPSFEQVLENELARYFEAFGRLEWLTNVKGSAEETFFG